MNLDYYPVLRSKSAEWRALGMVPSAVRSRIIPVVEMLPRYFQRAGKTAARKGSTAVALATHELAGLLNTHCSMGRLAVDGSMLNGDSPIGSRSLWSEINTRVSQSSSVLPVITRVMAEPTLRVIGDACQRFARGAVVRIGESDIASGDLRWITRALKVSGLTTDHVDVVADLRDQPLSIQHRVIRIQLATVGSWRSICVLAGVFPESLTQFHLPQQVHYWDRTEWTRWLSESEGTNEPPLNFGDYTVQPANPIDVQSVPSVSIRYTLEKRWMILRGKKPGDGFGNEQYFGHAILLRNRPEFYGEAFSEGDRYISRKATERDGTGRFTDWLAACINHHIRLVVAQLHSPSFSVRSEQVAVTHAG